MSRAGQPFSLTEAEVLDLTRAGLTDAEAKMLIEARDGKLNGNP